MRKVIAAINMTVNGNCDHQSGIADEELHQHYTELLGECDQILYGRITFQLMKYWQEVVKKPTGNKAMDEFAVLIDKTPKFVFSDTLKDLDWETAEISDWNLAEKVKELKNKPGKPILIGSRSLIIQLLEMDLIDEFQLCIHPVIETGGLDLFENSDGKKRLKLTKTKIFQSGAIVLYYKPIV